MWERSTFLAMLPLDRFSRLASILAAPSMVRLSTSWRGVWYWLEVTRWMAFEMAFEICRSGWLSLKGSNGHDACICLSCAWIFCSCCAAGRVVIVGLAVPLHFFFSFSICDHIAYSIFLLVAVAPLEFSKKKIHSSWKMSKNLTSLDSRSYKEAMSVKHDPSLVSLALSLEKAKGSYIGPALGKST